MRNPKCRMRDIPFPIFRVPRAPACPLNSSHPARAPLPLTCSRVRACSPVRAPLPHSIGAQCTHVMSGLDHDPERHPPHPARSASPSRARRAPRARALACVHAYPCACLPARSRVTSRARPRPHLHKPRNLPTASPFLPTYSLPTNPDIPRHRSLIFGSLGDVSALHRIEQTSQVRALIIE